MLVCGDKGGGVIILMENRRFLEECYWLKGEGGHKDMILDIVIWGGENPRIVTSSYDRRVLIWDYN